MKSCKKKDIINNNFKIIVLIILLTIKKQAPIIKAFILTSRSIGNDTLKLSAFVKHSIKNPLHCFDI